MGEEFSGNGRLSIDRRRALQIAGASALVGVTPLSRARAATPRPIKVGYVSPETGPLAPMGETDDFVLKGVRAAFKDGVANPNGQVSRSRSSSRTASPARTARRRWRAN